MMRLLLWCVVIFCIQSCHTSSRKSLAPQADPFIWENALVYFLLTDRFQNGDTSNDFLAPVRPAPYRGFMGGDVKGITQKINDNYFSNLGVTALWMTPLLQNIDGFVDEGTGISYGFHGYWIKDWTQIDPRVGTEAEVREMVRTAHARGIRVLFDVVINHTGPVTETDTQWPEEWVRTSPRCTYEGYTSTISCTLVDNLPDIKTESDMDVELPVHLVEKWKSEGRYEKEVAELNAFFKRTGYPRTPVYYIIKWLTDLIRQYGIDGFRVDTVKHTEEEVWKALQIEAQKAYQDWKKQNPDEMPGEDEFFMLGEVYNYHVSGGRWFDFGDRKVDYFDNGFHSLINFDFKYDAQKSYHEIFEKYDTLLFGPLRGLTTLNYISSHDDGAPFDKMRQRTFESATKLILTQGQSQIYYGDESARSLSIPAAGDATLRSFMNWDEIHKNKNLTEHWQKLGQYRKRHPAVGAGRHEVLGDNIFGRKYQNRHIKDHIVFAVDLKQVVNVIPVKDYFEEGSEVMDAYSGYKAKVKNGKVIIRSPHDIVLLEKI
jgi:alpha-amylase